MLAGLERRLSHLIHIVVFELGQPSDESDLLLLIGQLFILFVPLVVLRTKHWVEGLLCILHVAWVLLYYGRSFHLLPGQVFEFGDPGELELVGVVHGSAILVPLLVFMVLKLELHRAIRKRTETVSVIGIDRARENCVNSLYLLFDAQVINPQENADVG